MLADEARLLLGTLICADRLASSGMLRNEARPQAAHCTQAQELVVRHMGETRRRLHLAVLESRVELPPPFPFLMAWGYQKMLPRCKSLRRATAFPLSCALVWVQLCSQTQLSCHTALCIKSCSHAARRKLCVCLLYGVVFQRLTTCARQQSRPVVTAIAGTLIMSSPKEVLLGTVVPILGGIVAIVMYTSPLKATYAARKQQQLGVSCSWEWDAWVQLCKCSSCCSKFHTGSVGFVALPRT